MNPREAILRLYQKYHLMGIFYSGKISQFASGNKNKRIII
jgi:hypothetical protein